MKIQGKQIEDKTIEQYHLNLDTPTSGDTTSGATVNYVNTYVLSLSGETVIGPAEDGTYTDGIFTDFTDSTRVGVAIDRFNEMFKLLAPIPPTDSWDNVFSNLIIPSTYSARSLVTGSVTSNITNDTTPSYSITSIVSSGSSARSRNSASFTIEDTSVILETTNIDSGSTSKTSGIIQYIVADPYYGISGQAGFWTGVTNFSVSGTLSTITPSASLRSLSFTHPGSDSPESFNYYVNDAVTPSVNSLSATMPSMTRYISGLPSLSAGSVITDVSMTITNAVSYFYNNSLYDITGSLIVADSANPPSVIPTTHGQTIVESGLTVTVTSNSVFSDTNFQFTITVRNAAGTSGTNTYTSSAHRIDLVSNESLRLTSGTGNYPSIGWGGTYDSTESLISYSDEMMLKNGRYQYPSGNYTAFGGPDYSSISNTRWSTFNIGTFSNNSSFKLNFISSIGITSIIQSGLYIEIKISGATYWVNGNASYSGVGNPGSTSDGVSAMDQGNSTATSRKITFGAITYSGPIIVRIGIIGTGISFTSLTATNIV